MDDINKRDKEIAMDFLHSENMIDIIADDYEKFGLVNERKASLTVHYIASSCKLENPLAGYICSSSATGKSLVIEISKKLMVKDAVIDLSRMTPNTLFYQGLRDPNCIQHKFLIIAENVGAKEANYAIRLLLSEKKLSLWTTIDKEPVEIWLYGPISYIDSSTSQIFHEETSNRLLDIALNDSIEQNKAVLEYKKRRAVNGCNESEQQEIVRRHRTAQCLLKSMDVIIPYAMEILFPYHQTRTRRDFQKFIDLISVIAYLHQYQREKVSLNGKEYIKADVIDYEIAYNLIESIIKRSLDELKPKSRELYQIIKEFVYNKAKKGRQNLYDINFRRNDIVKDSQWTLRQVRTYIDDLVKCEYINVVSGNKGKEYVYRLSQSDIAENSKSEITTPEELREKLKE